MDLTNMSKNNKLDLAGNRNTPGDVLGELVKNNNDETLRFFVARNPNSSRELVITLLETMPFMDKRELAEDTSSTSDLLRILALDADDIVLFNLSYNPSTPVDVLRALAKDEHWGVRCNVAEHPKASSKILVMLFEYEKSLSEPHKYVIQALYTHKNLPAFAKRVIETLFGEML